MKRYQRHNDDHRGKLVTKHLRVRLNLASINPSIDWSIRQSIIISQFTYSPTQVFNNIF